MTPFVNDPDFTLYVGDVRECLRELPDESVHCVVTSPPYWGLRDYQVDGQIGLEPTPEAFVASMVEVFREVRRVLRADGTLWLNLGDSYVSVPGGQRQGANGQMADRTVVKARAQVQDTKAAGGAFAQRPPSVEGLKPKDLVGIPWRVAFALQADGWYLRSDIIWSKCLSGGTRLYAQTQKGEMPATLKDLARLDPATVKLWNGEKWTQVLAWTPAERDVQIELEFQNGERVGCTPEHRWPTEGGLLRADELQVGDVIPQTRLPEPDAPREFLPDAQIGYLVGLYLAEGSMSGDTVQLACHAEAADEIAERLTATTALLHGTAVAHRTGGKKATVNLNGPLSAAAIRAYVSGEGSKGKHLSPRAWARSNSFLRAVLDGYLDGDGHWDGSRWRLGFTANDALAADLRTLGARLGVSVRLRRCVHRCQTGDFPGWRGSIREKRREPDGRIVAIRRSRARRFWDVTVADEPHTFALASGLLTHNSNPMPESVTDRPTKAHEYVFLLTKSPRYFFDQEAVREPAEDPALIALAQEAKDALGGYYREFLVPNGRNVRSVWEIATQPYPDAHFATFPEALPARCIKAGTSEHGCCPECGAPWEREVERTPMEVRPTPKREAWQRQDDHARTQVGGTMLAPPTSKTTGWRPTCGHDREPVPCTVLDPFAGAGTTAYVARKLVRRSVGVELNPEYAQLAARRLQQQSLFAVEVA